MASTAQITDFHSGSTEGRSLLSRIGAGLMLAFEARAIYRVQQEAGHLLTEAQLNRMKADFERRRMALDA